MGNLEGSGEALGQLSLEEQQLTEGHLACRLL